MHFGLLKKWCCSAYGSHITVCQKPADGDGSQPWPRPLPAWLQLLGRMRCRRVNKTNGKTAEEIMLGQCRRYTWNVQAFRWYGMLSSFSYGKLLMLSAWLTAENKGGNTLNLD